MSGFRLVAQTCSLLYRRFVTCGPLAVQPRPADWNSAIQQSATLRDFGAGDSKCYLPTTPSSTEPPEERGQPCPRVGPPLLRTGGQGCPRSWDCPLTAPRLSRLCAFLALALVWFAHSCAAFAESAATNATACFRAVDIFVDSKDKPLAAYQLEFTATNGNARIVGIEGGGHPALAQPPFYDPKAMQHERVIIATFSMEAAEKLPTGRIRVATIHIQTRGATELALETRLQTAAGADGRKIAAEASSEERKSK